MQTKILSLLVLLLTAVTGAWADGVKLTTAELVPTDAWNKNYDVLTLSDMPGLTADGITEEQAKAWADVPKSGMVDLIYGYVDHETYLEFKIITFTNGEFVSSLTIARVYDDVYYNFNTVNINTYYATGVAEAPITVEWSASTKTGTFSMPASNVVLTPIYSAATVYGADGQTEKMAYETLKEAFANVQDGDVIKLDWNVTLTEHLATPSDGDGVKFTLDFNGYTIDGGTTYQIVLNNAGDQLTFTDSSDDQLGGLIAQDLLPVAGSEFVFVAGRYNLNGATAETINGVCADSSIPLSLAEGKEFVDIEGAPDADGFMVRVAYKAIELTIGAGKFATFYMDQNITLADGTDANIGLYTINGEGIDLANNTVTVTKVNDPIAIAGMPLLVYNGTTEQKTVTLKVTPVAPTDGQMWSSYFKGTAVDKTFTDEDMADNDYFALSGGKAFAPVRGTGTIAKNKCWLEFAKNNGNAPARQLTIVFDNGDATGVNEVIEVNEVSDDTLYDLNGRKLNAKPTRKGVYIKNGQKVVK